MAGLGEEDGMGAGLRPHGPELERKGGCSRDSSEVAEGIENGRETTQIGGGRESP